MIVYHGSNIEIDTIDLKRCRPYKDFGKGFYVTELKKQAELMAKRVSKIRGGEPIVTKFEIQDSAFLAHDMSVYDFGTSVSKEWAQFVMNNRDRYFKDIHSQLCNLDSKYDIVIGPIADDDLAMLFRQFNNKYINFDELVKGLEYKKTSNQISFHTERAITLLRKVGTCND